MKVDKPIYNEVWLNYFKKHDLTEEDKIFICDRRYVPLIDALVERDWHWNEDFHSPVFHLKYCVKLY